MMVPMQPPPSFLAPHPANMVLKNPFIILLFFGFSKDRPNNRIDFLHNSTISLQYYLMEILNCKKLYLS